MKTITIDLVLVPRGAAGVRIFAAFKSRQQRDRSVADRSRRGGRKKAGKCLHVRAFVRSGMPFGEEDDTAKKSSREKRESSDYRT